MSKPMVHLSTERLMRQLIVSLDELTQSNLALAQSLAIQAEAQQAILERIDALYSRAGDEVGQEPLATDLGQSLSHLEPDYKKEHSL
jgi:hypothetical protein